MSIKCDRCRKKCEKHKNDWGHESDPCDNVAITAVERYTMDGYPNHTKEYFTLCKKCLRELFQWIDGKDHLARYENREPPAKYVTENVKCSACGGTGVIVKKFTNGSSARLCCKCHGSGMCQVSRKVKTND